jgi:Uma2 family endonuclease
MLLLRAMAETDSVAPWGDSPLTDQRVILSGVSWNSYESLLRERGESKAVRLAYLEGELELMSPSHNHDLRAEMIGHLVMAWAEVFGVTLLPTGSWTVRKKGKKRGFEPDKSFVLGTSVGEAPDLCVEVTWTSGGLDKLDIYRGLSIPEVWFWRAGAIDVYLLSSKGYVRRRVSAVLKGLDPRLLAKYVVTANAVASIRAYRRALQRS